MELQLVVSAWEQLCGLRLQLADERKLLRRCGRLASRGGEAVALLQRFARGLSRPLRGIEAACGGAAGGTAAATEVSWGLLGRLEAARRRGARLLLLLVGAGATAAEWGDRGKHHYTSLGCHHSQLHHSSTQNQFKL